MTKPKESDRPGEKDLQKMLDNDKKRNKEKRNNNMKNIINSNGFKTFKHVALTLLTLIAIGAIFYVGFTQGEKHARGQDAYIQSQVQAKVLSAKTEAPALK